MDRPCQSGILADRLGLGPLLQTLFDLQHLPEAAQGCGQLSAVWAVLRVGKSQRELLKRRQHACLDTCNPGTEFGRVADCYWVLPDRSSPAARARFFSRRVNLAFHGGNWAVL